MNPWWIWLGALLFPPAGLLLLWLRPMKSVTRRVFATLAIVALGFAHLILFYGLHVELAGSGMRPIFSFYRPAKHYAALEQNRAHQPVAVTPAPQPVAEIIREEKLPPA